MELAELTRNKDTDLIAAKNVRGASRRREMRQSYLAPSVPGSGIVEKIAAIHRVRNLQDQN